MTLRCEKVFVDLGKHKPLPLPDEMNKSITHVFMLLMKRAEAGAREISVFLENKAMTSPELINVTDYINKQAPATKTKTWQHKINYQLGGQALNPFCFEDFLAFHRIGEKSYSCEFKALIESKCSPEVSYEGLQLDMDLNIRNKIARLNCIKMSIVSEVIYLKLHFKITD